MGLLASGSEVKVGLSIPSLPFVGFGVSADTEFSSWDGKNHIDVRFHRALLFLCFPERSADLFSGQLLSNSSEQSMAQLGPLGSL